MHDALRDALVIEMGDLLAQDEILEQRRAARAALERILIVGDRDALIGGQCIAGFRSDLMGLAAVARAHAVVALPGAFARRGR